MAYSAEEKRRIGARIRALRRERYPTMEAFGLALGLAPRRAKSVIANIETGRSLGRKYWSAMAELLGTSYEYIRTGIEPLSLPETSRDNEYPVVGHAAAATMGLPATFYESEEDPLVIPAGTSMAKVHGDSMAPLAIDGQRLFLAPESRLPIDGDLVVVWELPSAGGRTWFKRWGGWIGDKLLLLSVNPQATSALKVLIPRRDLLMHRVVVGVWYG